MGLLCDTKYFGGTHREIHQTGFIKGVLRTLVSFAIFSPFVIIINADIFNPDDFFEILFVVYVLPSFISGFFFFAFSRLLFEKCKLVTSDADCKKPGF